MSAMRLSVIIIMFSALLSTVAMKHRQPPSLKSEREEAAKKRRRYASMEKAADHVGIELERLFNPEAPRRGVKRQLEIEFESAAQLDGKEQNAQLLKEALHVVKGKRQRIDYELVNRLNNNNNNNNNGGGGLTI